VRGGIIDVFPATAARPARLEFFGDQLESMRVFALSDQRSIDEIQTVDVHPWSDGAPAAESAFIAEYAPDALLVIEDPDLIVAVDHSLAADRDDGTVAAADGEREPEAVSGSAASEADEDGAEPPALSLRDIATRLQAHAMLTFSSYRPSGQEAGTAVVA